MCDDLDRLEYLTERMHEFNRSVAPGTECEAWQDFVNDCMEVLGTMPWDDPDLAVTDSNFWGYWIDVANGVASDYNEDGSRHDSC